MKNKKVLIVASVASMIEQFNVPNIKILQELGFEVHVASNFNNPGNISAKRNKDFKEYLHRNNIKWFQVDFNRNPFHLVGLMKSYSQLKNIMKNKYDIVHSHSPIGGVLARLTAKKYRKYGLKSIYTAHGFHFFKGATKVNWLIYYPIEFILSYITDILITINQEDYTLAMNKFSKPKIYLIPGIGIDFKKFFIISEKEKEKIKNEMKISNKEFIITSIGELNNNKNHETVIRALHLLKRENSSFNFKYFICGLGKLKNDLEKLIIDLEMSNQIFLLGYKENINEILNVTSLFVFPSHREGLGLSSLEAMALGIPIITSNVHGINDYSLDGLSGYKCNPNDVKCFSSRIKKLIVDEGTRNKMGIHNLNFSRNYDQNKINKQMLRLYKSLIKK